MGNVMSKPFLSYMVVLNFIDHPYGSHPPLQPKPNKNREEGTINQTEVSFDGPVGQASSLRGCREWCTFSWNRGWYHIGLEMAPGSNIPEPVAMQKGHNGAACSLVIGANMLYSGSRDCTIRVDLQTLQCIQVLDRHSRDATSVLCWDSYLLSASLDHTLKGVVALCGIHDVEVQCILLCACKDNTIRLYDLPS